MKKLITTMVMLAILVFALSTSVQAYSMSYAGTKTEVESGETFNVTIPVDEQTALANGKLLYNSSLFTFVGATQSNMSAQAYPGEGKVNWMYTDLGSNDSELQKGTGTKTFVFTFKAADVTETKKGTFTLNDFVVTTTGDNEYDQDSNTVSGPKSVDVTIKKKTETPTDNWTIDPSKDFELSIGETKQIKTDGDVTWSTSDSKIATVDKDGNVKGIGKGTATITAKDKDGNTKSVKVTVNDIKWKLDPSGDITIKLDETKKIKTDEKVTWSTSNSKVVTVDKDGNIKGVGVGTATITATDKFGNKRTIKVTVVSKTAGTKDNTTTPDKKLPQTGEDFTRFACLALAGIVLVAGLVFKRKAKNLNKLFVILPLVAALSISGTVNAIKLVDSTKMKAGIFNDLIEGKNVIAVSPCKEFKTENSLTVDMVKSIVGMDILKIAGAKGNKIENSENIATGYVVTTPHPYSNGEQVVGVETNYEILLYGDANGDGKICNSLDVNVIRQDYVFNNKAEGVYKKAADLYADDVLNVRDVQRMVKKYLATLDGSLVTPFPGDKDINLDPSGDFDLGKDEEKIIKADTDVEWSWDKDSDVADVKVQDDGSVKVIGKNPGQIDITAKNEDGNEKTITVTVVCPTIEIADYTKNSITVKVTLEGKEIESIEHFYKYPEGYTKGPNPLKSAGTTTDSLFKYTNELLKDNEPYVFSAEITTKDGKKYKTNSVQRLMGNIGTTPEFTVDVKSEGNKAIVTVDVTNKEEVEKESKIKEYKYTVIKIPTGPNQSAQTVATVPSEKPTYTFENLEDGTYQVVVTVTTEKGANKTETKSFSIENSSDDGSTDDESLAVARVESTNKMYTSVQYAINAANKTKDTVTLLKDATESIEIVSEYKDLTLDINGKNLIGKAEKEYTIKTSGNLTVTTKGEAYATIKSGNDKATNILVEDNGNFIACCPDNSHLSLEVSGNDDGASTGTNILKNGSGNITVDGNVSVGIPTGRTVGIDDRGTGNIYINHGRVAGGTAIRKTGTGNIYIGEEDYEIGKLSVLGNLRVSGLYQCLWVNEDCNVYFYDGVLDVTGQETVDVTYPVCIDGFRDESSTEKTAIVHEFDGIRSDVNNPFYDSETGNYKHAELVGGADRSKATYRISVMPGYTEDQSKAIARVKSTNKMYTSVQYAVNAVETENDVVTLLKDTTESVKVEENKNITLDLNEKILNGAENEIYTINVLGNLKIRNGKLVRPTSTTSTENEGVVATNILLEQEGNATVLENTELVLQVSGGTNIANLGNGNIIIDGAYIHDENVSGGTNAIRDLGTNGNIYVYRGIVESSIAIIKRYSGNVYIGKDSKAVAGIDGVQENILSKDTTPDKLLVESIGQGKRAIDIGEDVQLYYYNGEIKGSINYTKEPILRTTDKIVCGDGDRGFHYEVLAEGESPIRFSELHTPQDANEVVTVATEAVSDIVNN